MRTRGREKCKPTLDSSEWDLKGSLINAAASKQPRATSSSSARTASSAVRGMSKGSGTAASSRRSSHASKRSSAEGPEGRASKKSRSTPAHPDGVPSRLPSPASADAIEKLGTGSIIGKSDEEDEEAPSEDLDANAGELGASSDPVQHGSTSLFPSSPRGMRTYIDQKLTEKSAEVTQLRRELLAARTELREARNGFAKDHKELQEVLPELTQSRIELLDARAELAEARAHIASLEDRLRSSAREPLTTMQSSVSPSSSIYHAALPSGASASSRSFHATSSTSSC